MAIQIALKTPYSLILVVLLFAEGSDELVVHLLLLLPVSVHPLLHQRCSVEPVRQHRHPQLLTHRPGQLARLRKQREAVMPEPRAPLLHVQALPVQEWIWYPEPSAERDEEIGRVVLRARHPIQGPFALDCQCVPSQPDGPALSVHHHAKVIGLHLPLKVHFLVSHADLLSVGGAFALPRPQNAYAADSPSVSDSTSLSS